MRRWEGNFVINKQIRISQEYVTTDFGPDEESGAMTNAQSSATPVLLSVPGPISLKKIGSHDAALTTDPDRSIPYLVTLTNGDPLNPPGQVDGDRTT
tara:strand:+ start:314 stop:604 length:291 start_codon:yes stop_codon:yes gene_type:complete